MNDLCVDIGYRSLNHFGEQLCGDHIDIIEQNENSTVIVLADGLGSGVKACILSTLTAKIISTMIAEGLSIEDCVETIAATLPVCAVRGVAYSTFTIMHILNNETAEIIQYDNPNVILLRNFIHVNYPITEMTIGGKKIYRSVVHLKENDIFILMSDGCVHAGIGRGNFFGWKLTEIATYMETFAHVGYTAKTLASILTDECNKYYGGVPGDDTTACVCRVRKRVPMNMLFGPPANRDDCNRMMALFFGKEGKHIICGGTTSSIAANYLGKRIKTSLNFDNSGMPPIAEIEGVDLVTEGVITVNKVVEYAKDYLNKNDNYETWSFGSDGASKICQLLFEEATDINFFVGRAINPAHQNPELPITFSIKMAIVEELAKCLKQMGKRIKVSYF